MEAKRGTVISDGCMASRTGYRSPRGKIGRVRYVRSRGKDSGIWKDVFIEYNISTYIGATRKRIKTLVSLIMWA